MQAQYIFLRVVITAILLSQEVGHGRKVYACGALRRWFKPRLHEVVFGVILVLQQNNTKYYMQT